MRWSTKQCIEATLLYSELFDYPLTQEEIHYWVLTPWKQPPPVYSIQDLSLYKSGNYYSLNKSQSLLKLRQKREQASQKKWKIILQARPLFRLIPTVLLVGVSGGLSMNNADAEDDIDLFILCSSGTIWATRFAVLVLLEILGRRRQYGQKKESNLLCANMYITDDRLRLPVHERDVYSAHEILQMTPVYTKGDVYLRFLHENAWVRYFLPHAYPQKIKIAQQSLKTHGSVLGSIGVSLFKLSNPYLRLIQQRIMKNKVTNEVISDYMIRFHPQDTRRIVKKSFPEALKKRKIPLDSKFFRMLT